MNRFCLTVAAAMAAGCCVMTNGGAAAGLVLDFGRELHGGLRIAASARSAKTNCRAAILANLSDAERTVRFDFGGTERTLALSPGELKRVNEE